MRTDIGLIKVIETDYCEKFPFIIFKSDGTTRTWNPGNSLLFRHPGAAAIILPCDYTRHNRPE